MNFTSGLRGCRGCAQFTNLISCETLKNENAQNDKDTKHRIGYFNTHD